MFLTRHKITGHTKLWTSLYLALALSMGLVACGGGGGDSATAPVAGGEANPSEVATTVAAAEEANIMKELEDEADMPSDESQKACKDRNNNTFKKLLTCVTLDGVRTHQAKLRDIALANNGTRVSGTKGFDDSAVYAEKVFKDAGYNVTKQDFVFQSFIELPGTSLTQVSPTPTATIGTNILSYSGSGSVTATVSVLPTVTGCNTADFAGFTAGNIALISRGACSFAIKATNAQTAGASAVVIYNNIPGELGGDRKSVV